MRMETVLIIILAVFVFFVFALPAFPAIIIQKNFIIYRKLVEPQDRVATLIIIEPLPESEIYPLVPDCYVIGNLIIDVVEIWRDTDE